MTLETAGAVTLVVGAICTLIGVIYKLRPEADKISVDTALTSVKMARDDRDDCENKLAKERQENLALRAENLRLKTTLTHYEDEQERREGGSAAP